MVEPVNRIRVGIAGTGSWAVRHIEAWRASPDAEITAICGRTRSTVEALARKYGIPEVHLEYSRLVERTDIDAVSISLPHCLHYPVAMAALAAGKHVFCEKPLAMDAAQALALVERACTAGVRTGIQFGHRVAPAVIRMREMVRAGELGEIRYVEGRANYDLGSDPAFPLVWRFRKDIAGAGALGDLGVYTIDNARWVVGEIREVSGSMRIWIPRRPQPPDGHNLYEVQGMYRSGSLPADAPLGDVTNDDECSYLVRFHGGAEGHFRTTRLDGEGGWGMSVNGSRGSLSWNGDSLWWRKLGDREAVAVPLAPKDPAVTFVTPFIADIRNGTENGPGFRDGWEAQRVMDAVITSAETQRWVSVGAEESRR